MAFDTLQDRIGKSLKNIAGKGKLTEKNMEDALQEIRIALLESDVNYNVVKDFLTKVSEEVKGQDVINGVEPGQQVVKIVHDELIKLLGDENVGLNYKQSGLTTVMIVGLQGSGKTTNLAKVAKNIRDKGGRKPLLFAGDLQRPAAVEQLKTLGASIGVEVYSEGLEVDILKQVKNAYKYAIDNDYDTLLVDTAGRLQIDNALMEELRNIKDIIKPDDILLTVDALTGQDIINVSKEFNEQLSITGLVVTKFDGDSKGGAVLSVKAVTNVPVKFVGVGEKIDELEVFYPERVAERLLGMGDIVSLVEKAEEVMDQEAAEKAYKRMMEGTFTLDDMLVQIEQTQKMGPLQGIMKMIPGMGDMTRMLDGVDTEKEFKKTKAIIQSMTPYERAHPNELRGTHKRRIAAGSGTRTDDVNKVINQYEKMKKVMGVIPSLMNNPGLLDKFIKR